MSEIKVKSWINKTFYFILICWFYFEFRIFSSQWQLVRLVCKIHVSNCKYTCKVICKIPFKSHSCPSGFPWLLSSWSWGEWHKHSLVLTTKEACSACNTGRLGHKFVIACIQLVRLSTTDETKFKKQINKTREHLKQNPWLVPPTKVKDFVSNVPLFCLFVFYWYLLPVGWNMFGED